MGERRDRDRKGGAPAEEQAGAAVREGARVASTDPQPYDNPAEPATPEEGDDPDAGRGET